MQPMIPPVARFPDSLHLPSVQQPGLVQAAGADRWRAPPRVAEPGPAATGQDSLAERWRSASRDVPTDMPTALRADGRRHLVLPAASAHATAATTNRPHPAAPIMKKDAYSGPAAAPFHWRSAPPELLLAMQEGGRARMATLARYAR